MMKTRSIRGTLTGSFIAIIFYIVIVVSMSVTMNNDLMGQYSKLINRGSKLTQLQVVTSDIQVQFEQYLRTRDQKHLTYYDKDMIELEYLLASLKEESINRPDVLSYLRVINVMKAYCKESIHSLFKQESLSNDDYREIQFINKVFYSMGLEMQQMADRDFEFSRFAYKEIETQHRAKALTGFYSSIFVFMLLAMALIFILRQIYQSTKGLVKAANALSENKWWIEDIAYVKYSEINMVSKAFNNMKNKIHDYIIQLEKQKNIEIKLHKKKLENERKDKLLKQAQLKTLQMQVNPHFLFNTLNIIGKSTVLERPEQSLELLEATGMILRYSLEHLEELVTLEQEIEIVEAYLTIQKARFQSQIKFIMTNNEAVKDVLIPPMIIQPLIENAIKHGFTHKISDKCVEINIIPQDDYLLIEVRDNGKGMKQEDLMVKKSNVHIGLWNLKKRLELHFKQENLMLIDSLLGEYTKITLKIPFREDK